MNEDFKALQTIINYKAKESWANVKNIEDDLKQFEKEGDKAKTEAWKKMLDTSTATWVAYKDVQHIIEILTK